MPTSIRFPMGSCAVKGEPSRRKPEYATALHRPNDSSPGPGASCRRTPDMSNIVVTEFISLDGIVEDPGGAEACAPADWTAFDRSVEGYQLKMVELEEADVQRVGRV